MISTLLASWILPLLRKLRTMAGNIWGRHLRPASFLRTLSDFEVKPRRSAHYHPTVWDPKRIESFETSYSYKLYAPRLEELKRMARLSLETADEPRSLLNLIDSMERLGVAYHFEDEIREAVSLLHQDETTVNYDLHMTAMRFRILREHGLSVSTDVFDRFRGDDGRFSDRLSSDVEVEGILSLFEASHLGMPGEDILDEARNFSLEQLNFSSISDTKSHYLAKKIEQSLQVPLHWRMPRLDAREFINLYELDEAKNPTLLELAKLDYNLVQSVYQTELKELARWWRELGFKENLEFARDRLMENYLWVMGIVFEPRLSKCRIGSTKFVCILTAIDDMYDVYGSLDELECFTTAVGRWDIEAIMDLPLYMKVCYMAMFNFGNELIYDVLKNHGFNVSSYIKEEWFKLCRSYLVEARWFFSEHTPSLEEYLGNAFVSVGGPAGVAHACILMLGSALSKASLESCLNSGSKLIYWSSLITRFSDDLGTSKDERKRGDVRKAVECCMEERGVPEEEARNHIRELRRQTWKMMNKEILINNNINNNNGLPNAVVRVCFNMARTSQCIFQYGDGIGTSTGITKHRLDSLIVKPVQFHSNLADNIMETEQ